MSSISCYDELRQTRGMPRDLFRAWRGCDLLETSFELFDISVPEIVVTELKEMAGFNSRMLTRTEAKTVLDKIAQNRDWLESQIYEESKKWLTK